MVEQNGRRVAGTSTGYADIRKNPLYEVSRTAFGLGVVLGIFLGSLALVRLKNFHLYIVFLCLFHFLEYYITARYNPTKVNVDSFLLNNGVEYIACHTLAILETLIEYVYAPGFKTGRDSRVASVVVVLGYVFILGGQAARSWAMVTASSSFSHVLEKERREDHILVKHGIYRWLRHPSYFGFFWWALGTQMVLLNPVSFVLFAIVLWRFFSARIASEESYLIEFFGNDYVRYRNGVPVRIPFIK
ncbi:hypothetical protein HG536_0A05280 [Torulaspora globosa]|uniref:Protein-S-isoprenylcysteine O-methyltransferase n=1 Tax=Torulaspora globosa TaxID=48254 RepID=A0A7G3ZB27_9SACH|nr:uncharacterized protein HG536_0A05280 [Torulaspora globosa]QLL30713.1 hypothetical protein HG536_0A05280 [Torulaspora globosa]